MLPPYGDRTDKRPCLSSPSPPDSEYEGIYLWLSLPPSDCHQLSPTPTLHTRHISWSYYCPSPPGVRRDEGCEARPGHGHPGGLWWYPCPAGPSLPAQDLVWKEADNREWDSRTQTGTTGKSSFLQGIKESTSQYTPTIHPQRTQSFIQNQNLESLSKWTIVMHEKRANRS